MIIERNLKGQFLPKKKIKRICKNCDKVFKTWLCRVGSKRAIYCGRKCRDIQHGLKLRGKNHPNWVGDKIKKGPLHGWIHRNYGKAKKCEKCGSTKSIEWANKDGKYKRDINNFMQLCTSCHSKYDNIVNNFNKNTSTIEI